MRITELIDELVKKTEGGDLQWRQSQYPACYKIAIENMSILLFAVDSMLQHDSLRYRMRIVDRAGRVIADADDYQLMQYEHDDAKKNPRRITELYRVAQQSALHAFDAYETIMNAIKKSA